jgi:hypothetical protein
MPHRGSKPSITGLVRRPAVNYGPVVAEETIEPMVRLITTVQCSAVEGLQTPDQGRFIRHCFQNCLGFSVDKQCPAVRGTHFALLFSSQRWHWSGIYLAVLLILVGCQDESGQLSEPDVTPPELGFIEFSPLSTSPSRLWISNSQTWGSKCDHEVKKSSTPRQIVSQTSTSHHVPLWQW